jgi:hypothetical protein
LSKAFYYALTLHAFSHRNAAALAALATRRSSSARVRTCLYVRISNCSRKAKHADAIRSSADEICS